jgi:acetyl-CoA carboxylase beta subunit
VEVTHLRRHLKKVHSDAAKAPPVAPRKRASRVPEDRSGELWAKCPECHVPVKDAELFKHLLNCPGADVRRAEWVAQQPPAAAPDGTDAPQ